jgi:hypothetical protein
MTTLRNIFATFAVSLIGFISTLRATAVTRITDMGRRIVITFRMEASSGISEITWVVIIFGVIWFLALVCGEV